MISFAPFFFLQNNDYRNATSFVVFSFVYICHLLLSTYRVTTSKLNDTVNYFADI